MCHFGDDCGGVCDWKDVTMVLFPSIVVSFLLALLFFGDFICTCSFNKRVPVCLLFFLGGGEGHYVH